MNIINQLAKTASDQSMETLEKFGNLGQMASNLGGMLPQGIKEKLLAHGVGVGTSMDPMVALQQAQQTQALAAAAQHAAKVQQMKEVGLGAGGLLAGGGIAAALMGRAKKRKED